MAKKPPKLTFNLDFTCEIEVPAESRKAFEKDLKRGELSISAELTLGSEVNFFNIYSDNVEGSIAFGKISDTRYSVSAKGAYVTDDDSGILAVISKLKATPKLILTSVSDSEPNSYYVDGDEDKTVEIGSISS